MMDTPLWWVRSGAGPAKGPYTAAQVKALVATGVIADDSRLWSDGADWGSAADFCRSARPDAAVRRWSRLALPLTALLYALCIAGVGLLFIDPFLLGPPRALVWLWPLTGMTLVAVSVLGVLTWWRAAKQMNRSPETAGLLKVVIILLGVGGIMAAYINLSRADFAMRSAAVLEEYVYRVSVDQARNRLTVVGAVGPGFGRAVERGLAQLDERATVEINSMGGLIDEGLIAAKAIEQRSSSRVIVRDRCISACMLVLMGGRTRLADYDAFIAFHAVSPLVEPHDRFTSWAVQTLGEQSDAFLTAHGVPVELTRTANRLGPDKISRLPMSDALDRRVLNGLVSGDQPVTLAQAHALLNAGSPD